MLHAVYAFIQDVPIGEEPYRRIIENLGAEPVAGSLLHLPLEWLQSVEGSAPSRHSTGTGISVMLAA
jgi:hypothetical protein